MNKTTIRQSNIELLRIISMFMVMLLHTTQAIGYPDYIPNNTTEFYFVGLTKAVSVVAVNVFVMISGWFGIRYSIKGLFRFLFQVLFFAVVGYIMGILFKATTFSISDFCAQGLMLSSRHYWFVGCYLLLFALSPILNLYCENATKRQFATVLLTLLAIQTTTAWLFPTFQAEIKGGYSAVSFITLYLIARYVRIHTPRWSTMTPKYDAIVYAVLTLVLSVIAYFTHGGGMALIDFYSYTSPLVIVSSLFLLLAFTKFSFQNKAINIIAASSFAVYLLHECLTIKQPLYREVVADLYHAANPAVSNVFDVLGFILLVYVLAIVIDKVRILLSDFLISMIWKSSR